MDANGFDFFGVAPGGGFDGPGAGIAQDTEGNGGIVALLFVAFKAEGDFLLAQALVGDFEAVVVLLHFEEQGSGGGAFYDIIRVGLGGFSGVEKFEDFAGGDGGSGGGEAARAGFGQAGGILTEVFGGSDAFFAKPALIADLAPVGHVLFGDRLALEFGGEDGFDGGEFVEPGEDFGVALAVEEALVDLFAEFVGETGDFAGEGVVGDGNRVKNGSGHR